MTDASDVFSQEVLAKAGGVKDQCTEELLAYCAACKSVYPKEDVSDGLCPVHRTEIVAYRCGRCEGEFSAIALLDDHPCRSRQAFESRGFIAFEAEAVMLLEAGEARRLEIEHQERARETEARERDEVARRIALIERLDELRRGAREAYCAACRSVYPADDVVDGLCPIHRTPVEFRESERHHEVVRPRDERRLRHEVEPSRSGPLPSPSPGTEMPPADRGLSGRFVYRPSLETRHRSKAASVIWSGITMVILYAAIPWGYGQYKQWNSKNESTQQNTSQLAPVTTLAIKDDASFDCAKENTDSERFICASPEVAALDRNLAERYRALIASVPEDLKELILVSQREWLKYWPVACSTDAHKLNLDSGALSCVKREYQARIEELEISTIFPGELFGNDGEAKQVDWLKSIQISRFKSQLAVDSDDTTASHFIVSYPQLFADDRGIFTEATTLANKWLNPAKVEPLNAPEYGEDFELTRRLTALNNDLLMMHESVTSFPHGNPHEVTRFSADYYLVSLRRPLKVEDIFIGDAWQGYLSKLVSQRFGHDLADEVAIFNYVGQLSRWSFEPDGLVLSFNVYEVTPYAAGPQELAVSWNDLTPFMTELGLRLAKNAQQKSKEISKKTTQRLIY